MESDLKIDTYRASGAGGQHVNTTDSAVRITHVPTGIIVACQTRTLAAQEPCHRDEDAEGAAVRTGTAEAKRKRPMPQAAKTDIGWGHQIRSYVLQPYQLVKDLRTGVHQHRPSAVLDGDLDEFIQASLAHRVYGGDDAPVEDIE